MDPRHSLRVRRRVPVQVEEHETRRTDKVDPCAAALRGQEEGERGFAVGAVEFVDELLALTGGGLAVETEEGETAGGEERLEEVQGGGVIRDEDDFFRGGFEECDEHAVEDAELAGVGGRFGFEELGVDGGEEGSDGFVLDVLVVVDERQEGIITISFPGFPTSSPGELHSFFSIVMSSNDVSGERYAPSNAGFSRIAL